MKFEASRNASSYFRKIQGAAQLTANEEKELAIRIQSGDEEARAVLIRHNLKLVMKLANRHIGQGVPIDDLIQEGNIGLMEAAGRFLPETGARFASYASLWIRKRLNEAVAQTGRIVRLPHNKEIELYHKGQEKLTEYSVPSEVPTKVAIDRPVGDGDGTLMADLLLHTPSATNQQHEEEAVKAKVTGLLGTLKPRDKEILLHYFGIGQDYEVPTDQIAEKFGMTNVRVSQIVRASLTSLKEKL